MVLQPFLHTINRIASDLSIAILHAWFASYLKWSIFGAYHITDRHTDTQDDCYNPLPTLGLIIYLPSYVF